MKASAARGRVSAEREWSNRLVPALLVTVNPVRILPETESPVPALPATEKPVRNVLTESAQSARIVRSEADLNAIPEFIPVINSKSIVSNMRIRQNRSVSINTSLMQVSVPVARQMILSKQV